MTRTMAVLLLAAVPACTRVPSDNPTLTAVDGLLVGHHTLAERPTGCTVILADGLVVAGVSQRGSAPGTRDTDLLQSVNAADRVDAVVLSGGSAFGLDVATGVMRWLDEGHGQWFGHPADAVPIVPAAVLIDLWVGGKPTIRPSADCGYRAAGAASRARVAEGSVGAGAGATVGKLTGLDRAMKGGICSAAVTLPGGLRVAALAAVNALGDVVDPASGAVVAGVRADDGSLRDVRKLLRSGAPLQRPRVAENTTLAVVATNAHLTKAEANRVALMADAGIARAVTPAHTTADGDTVFALATGRWRGRADLNEIGALAADVLAEAIVRAVKQATVVAGIPAARDIK
jgi:L-aminopeptidase/D-esterase-like protein